MPKKNKIARLTKLPQCPPNAATTVAGPKYDFHANMSMKPTVDSIGRFAWWVGIS